MKTFRKLLVVMTIIAAFVVVLPAAAQETSPAVYPTNTITVTGLGQAFGAPDKAVVMVGAEVVGSSAGDAFAQVNNTVQSIIDAVTALGIARVDIRTNYLSIYMDYGGMPYPMDMDTSSMQETGKPAYNYRASNSLEITVRDIAQIEAVIDAAIGAGASRLDGLSFAVSNPVALEAEARVGAMEDARTRAQQLAELVGATLGDAIIINETPGGFYGPVMYDMASQGRGGGGAVVEPGQSAVQVALQVTFRINR
jgi:uncharacterized protein